MAEEIAKSWSGELLSNPFLSRWTLRFKDPLEANFRVYFCKTTLTATRQAIGIGILMYFIYGALDPIHFPGVEPTVWKIRFGIICPLLIGFFALTFTRYWARFFLAGTPGVLAVASFDLLAIIAATGRSQNIFELGAIPMILMFGFITLHTRYIYVAATACVISAASIALAAFFQTPGTAEGAAALIAVDIIGIYGTRQYEYFVRKAFVQGLIIAERNAKLETTNREVSAANRQLAKSREELVESGKRADLIFSALSEALPGTVIDDKYLIEARVGSGGYGTVYRAQHLMLNTVIAIKIFKPIAGNDLAVTLERFRIEGASAQRVSHPNAVRVFDFGISMNSIAYLVMEFLDGHSLDEDLKDGSRLSIARAVHILESVCGALASAHQVGVLHRDIKPGNVFVSGVGANEVIKLVDFGIAKIVDGSAEVDVKNVTATGIVIGTPNYMAPERFLAKAYDGLSDVYSLGILAYELFTGALPFENSARDTAQDYMHVGMRHIQTAPKPISEHAASVPRPLADLVMRMIAKDPRERPSAHEVAKRLGAISATLPK